MLGRVPLPSSRPRSTPFEAIRRHASGPVARRLTALAWGARVERLVPIGLLALAVVLVPVLVFEPEGLPRLRALEHELADVHAENADLEHAIVKLRAEVAGLRKDPAAVERIARDQLGLVRKSEIVFHFGR